MLKNQKAFTLIELMVTVSVLAVVISLAIPSFNSMIVNNRSVALGEDFGSAINFARSEALKRGTRVSLCASDDGAACNGKWTDGYIAIVDTADTDKSPDPKVGTVLKVWEKANDQAVITVKSDSEELFFLRFTGLGTLAKVKAKPLDIDVRVKKCTGDSARKISVGLSGMVSIARASCSAP